MMQESIYCKLSPNSTLADAAIENVRKNKPSKGLVQILRVTEKQFAKMLKHVCYCQIYQSDIIAVLHRMQ